LQEINLDASIDEFLSAESGFTYSDLYAMLAIEYTLARLSPHEAVARAVVRDENLAKSWRQVDGSCYFRFRADGQAIDALVRSPEHLLEIGDVVLRLLAASVVHSVILNEWTTLWNVLVNAPTLAFLMEQYQSLKDLKLINLEIDEGHCRVLGVSSRSGLKIELFQCKLTSAGTSALAEVMGSNQGPTKLIHCMIDYSVLANGLRGNSRLKSLTLCDSQYRVGGSRELCAIADALKENKGLDDLDLGRDSRMNDETWDAVCDSLKTHPTLQVLNLGMFIGALSSPAKLKSRIRAIVDMLKESMSIDTIHMDHRYMELGLFQESVIPYLETNKFRPRVRAIQKTRPIAYRVKVLGRALLVTRTDANSFWIFYQGMPKLLFRRRLQLRTSQLLLLSPLALFQILLLSLLLLPLLLPLLGMLLQLVPETSGTVNGDRLMWWLDPG
jgi:hypothetical protein